MVPPVIAVGHVALVLGGAAEFPAPNHQRNLQQPALFQIANQRRRGLVHVLAGLGNFRWQVAVMIPASMIKLHEAHPTLDQTSRQQAIVRKRRFARLSAVLVEHLLRFLLQIHQLRHACLHPVGHLEGLDARVDLGVTHSVQLHLVQVAHAIEETPPHLVVDPFRV